MGEYKISQNQPNVIDPVVFRRPSNHDLRSLWNPDFPPFDPIIDLKDLAFTTCPYYSYYKNLIGLDPFNRNQCFIQPSSGNRYLSFGRDLTEFHRVIVETLKNLVWNERVQDLANQDPEESERWRTFLRSILSNDQNHLEQYLLRLLGRLFREGALGEYPNYQGRVFFNFQIFNPEFYIDQNNRNRIFNLITDPNTRSHNQRIFRWSDFFSLFAELQELNLERREIVLYWFYTEDFIPRNVFESETFRERELHFLIDPLLLYLWSMRSSLSSLEDHYLNDFRIRYIVEEIFSPIQNLIPDQTELQTFRLRLETIDGTYGETDINFDPENLLAERLIAHQLSMRSDYWRIFHLEKYCPRGEPRDPLCNVSWACRMREFVSMPIPLVARNVKIFQRSLRDEITLACKKFYYLYRFILSDTQEYRRRSNFWIGDVNRSGEHYIYEDFINELYTRAPRNRELQCIFLTPFMFPKDYQIRLIEDGDLTLIENIDENQSIFEIKENFSQNEPLRILIGKFPKIRNINLLERQQDNLWRACNFQRRWEREQEIGDLNLIKQHYLRTRLRQNNRRAGEGIFGDRVHFY